jgi:flagellar FliJ protein
MQNLLTIDLKLEDQAKSAFGAAKAKVNEEEAKLLALEQRKEGYKELLTKMMEGQLNLRDIRQTEDAVEIIKYKMELQKVAIKVANQELELARIKLDEATKERKIQENLKEKAFVTFMDELKQEEQKEVDERVTFQYRDSEDR